MQRIVIILFTLFCFSACSTSKRPKIITKKSDLERKSTKSVTPVSTKTETADYSLATSIIDNAREFYGVRYKYGGTTSKGMDCSGLIYTAFKQEQIKIPRTSLAMSKKGKPVALDEVQKGDLLFFQTRRKKKVVNHVGLVIESQPGLIEFIHATSGNGVIISTLNESYWNLAFYQARRVL